MRSWNLSASPARRFAALATLTAAFTAAVPARAVNPLEYPGGGASSLARGGAWLATASDPIAVHYNPAALATQASAVGLSARLNFTKICFDRRDQNGDPTGPSPDTPAGRDLQYVDTCNQRRDFPLGIPALSMTWRATDTLGFGIGFVPPSAYGTAREEWPSIAQVRDTTDGSLRPGPSPYRYMTMGNQSTITFPTASVGWEPFKGFRVGAGFIAGFAAINVRTAGIMTVYPDRAYDVASSDSASWLRTQDLFIPGFVASMLWSVTESIDVAAWGRVSEGVDTESGTLEVQTNYYTEDLRGIKPICTAETVTSCSPTIKNEYEFGPDKKLGKMKFKYPFPPPEVRLGVRYHHPRVAMSRKDAGGHAIRDPLHDDLFDIEVDGSYTWNSVADTVTVRFPADAAGKGAKIEPTGNLPPIADLPNGFTDSWGIRVGGQYNVLQDKLGLMAGTWYETQSQRPELLSVMPPGPARGGFGGGIVFRQEFIDITFGYQFHWKATLDNGGNGLVRAKAGTANENFSVNKEPTDLPAEDYTQFRSYHTINGGKVTQRAHVFALGGVIRF